MNRKATKRRKKTGVRMELSQKAPRNPYALAARQRQAGAHRVTPSSLRQTQQRLLAAALKEPKDE